MIQINTSRLTLRPILNTDWSLWLELHQQPDVMRFIGEITDEATLREKFNRGLSAGLGQWHKEDNTWLTLVIEETATATPIGLHGFLSMWTPFQQAELGFMLSPNFKERVTPLKLLKPSLILPCTNVITTSSSPPLPKEIMPLTIYSKN